MKGTITPLDAGTGQVLAFVRDSGGQRVLVLHNVSAVAANAGPLAVDATRFDPIFADDGAATRPTGSTGAWRFTLAAHSSAAWLIR